MAAVVVLRPECLLLADNTLCRHGSEEGGRVLRTVSIGPKGDMPGIGATQGMKLTGGRAERDLTC
jgi:hypothetical protein